ncbi:uncharacterized protein MELLADRAFT_88140 [Melampsora larici-populina 98AG31]|uniref:Arrestin-like N-terminal domain-containing protein n=1 Tax=Melampsora larici-populina (strain 98AG31 / pathotype 3-4-7) TaxID=747676 RepID=F4RQQ2_MELLP|nr:uncharacterized protein MELLADRAFT_88140 [Melampsora larici-populina 98AG31]EGG05282.1 hypothetical protein MELLADRAFT_88140 [Melampsora larici-populina 98AG31]
MSNRRSESLTVPEFSTNRNPSSEPISGDELPSYTRRPQRFNRPASYAGPSSLQSRASHQIPLQPSISEQPPPRAQIVNLKPHIVISSSGKIQLTLFSPSQARYPVLLQGFDEELRGELKLNLGELGECFSEIRVKLKGVVSTTVVRSQGNNTDEIVFLQLDQSLYQPPLIATSEHRLSGTKTFPFKFFLPAQSSNDVTLPPSFALTSSAPDAMAPFTRARLPSKTVEWASVKYYIKVTLARRGLLRSNDRLLAPFVLLSRQTQPPITSMTRQAAFNLGLPLPNPMEDPDGWMGRKIRQYVKIPSSYHTSGPRSAWYEVMVLLPSPLCYGRNRPLPYFLKFTSSDPSVTTDFAPSYFEVSLLQRATLTALGVSGTHEASHLDDLLLSKHAGRVLLTYQTSCLVQNTLSKGIQHPDGPNRGIHAPSANSPYWSRRYEGELLLGTNAVPDFTCPNIVVQYFFNLRVSVPNQATDLIISLPIQLVSAPRQSGSAIPRLRDPTPNTLHDPQQGSTITFPIPSHHLSGLSTEDPSPPSYWAVQEMDAQT